MIYFELRRINSEKLQTVITFDKEVRWRRVKNESCSKGGNESSCQFLKGAQPKFQKSIIYYHFLVLFGFFLGTLRF